MMRLTWEPTATKDNIIMGDAILLLKIIFHQRITSLSPTIKIQLNF